MFKYLPITSNLKEMMIMVNSLPTCTLVLDKNCNLVEINQMALKFLNLKSKDDYKVKRTGILNDVNYLKSMLKELAAGREIRDKSHFVHCVGGQTKVVNFSACLIEGPTKMYIFQFYEIPVFPNLLLDFQNKYAKQISRNTRLINRNKGYRSVKLLFEKKGLNTAYRCYLQECTIQLFAKKYTGLTQDEVLICSLIALNMSINEIAVMLNKLSTNVRASIYRIMAKFDLKSLDSLYDQLMVELPYSAE